MNGGFHCNKPKTKSGREGTVIKYNSRIYALHYKTILYVTSWVIWAGMADEQGSMSNHILKVFLAQLNWRSTLPLLIYSLLLLGRRIEEIRLFDFYSSELKIKS